VSEPLPAVGRSGPATPAPRIVGGRDASRSPSCAL